MSAPDPARPRVVALYLPHFYPEVWGSAGPTPISGATAAEPGAWQQLAKAQPLFPGHEQPRAPADLGYCDLRVPEVRQAQTDLARAYGIDAFCYLHDWSAGQRRFARPFDEMLASGEPDFPFCLCWANESRTLADLSSAQARADDRAHATFLAAAFADPRYLRMGSRPVFVVRQPQELADPAGTLGAIREAAARRGVGDPLLLAAGGEAGHAGVGGLGGIGDVGGIAAGSAGGFDGELDWPRLERESVAPQSVEREPAPSTLGNLVRHRRWLPHLAVEGERAARRRLLARPAPGGPIPVVLAGWDDSPLRGRAGTVFTGRRPELFESDLLAALRHAESSPASNRMVFVYAWNGWLQGAALEPDRRFGRAYLAAIARARIQATAVPEGGITTSDRGVASGRGRPQ